MKSRRGPWRGRQRPAAPMQRPAVASSGNLHARNGALAPLGCAAGPGTCISGPCQLSRSLHPGGRWRRRSRIMKRLSYSRRVILAVLLAASALRCGDDGVEPSAPTTIEMVAGSGQSGVVGQQLAQPLVVRVLDQSGNPVAGVVVTWTAQG